MSFNVNDISDADIKDVPGVGTKTYDRIIAYREGGHRLTTVQLSALFSKTNDWLAAQQRGLCGDGSGSVDVKEEDKTEDDSSTLEHKNLSKTVQDVIDRKGGIPSFGLGATASGGTHDDNNGAAVGNDDDNEVDDEMKKVMKYASLFSSIFSGQLSKALVEGLKSDNPRGGHHHGPKVSLPYFYGEINTWDAFKLQFDRLAVRYKWNNVDKVDQLVFAIRDKALDAYSLLSEKQRNSWPLLVKEFEAQFARKETPEEMRRLLKVARQEPEESVREFSNRIYRMALRGVPDGNGSAEAVKAFAMDAFFEGLADKDAALFAANLRPDSLEQSVKFVEMCKTNKKTLKVRSVHWEPPSEVRALNVSPPSSSKDISGKELLSELSKVASLLTSLVTSTTEVRDEIRKDRENRSRERTGSRSSSPGNSGSRNRSQSPKKEITCFKCGELGHYANECTNQKKN